MYIQLWCNDNLQGRPKCMERSLSQYHFVNHKSHMNCLGINSCFEEEKLENIRLSSCWAWGIAQRYTRLCVRSNPLSSFLSAAKDVWQSISLIITTVSFIFRAMKKNWREDVVRWENVSRTKRNIENKTDEGRYSMKSEKWKWKRRNKKKRKK